MRPDWARVFQEIKSPSAGLVELDAPLSRFTYYQIGGNASVLTTPRTWEDLEKIHEALVTTGVPFFILGWGSNLLFRDEGYPGVILRMKHLFTKVEEVPGGILKVGASLGASSLLRIASERGYVGLSRFTGIPGSVGGMVAMNAGTHRGEMSGVIRRSEWVNLKAQGNGLQLQSRIHEASDFSYRRNHFLKSGDLLTQVELQVTPGDPSEVKAEIDELYQRRKATQPVEYPSCGSVFMNPEGTPLRAWQVVEKLGLRGHQIGGAQISEKHPNFIVNRGGARAAEVRALIELVRERARTELGIELHPEVKIL